MPPLLEEPVQDFTSTRHREFFRRRIRLESHGMTKFFAYIAVFIALSGTALADSYLMSADTAHGRARAGDITLIDIRSPKEWRQTGIPDGAIAVTMHDENGIDAFYENVLAAVGHDKSKPIALICAAGNRSHWARNYLAAQGFQNVRDVSEGFFGNGKLPGWLARGLPIVSR